jgi:hypothetical protein
MGKGTYVNLASARGRRCWHRATCSGAGGYANSSAQAVQMASLDVLIKFLITIVLCAV